MSMRPTDDMLEWVVFGKQVAEARTAARRAAGPPASKTKAPAVAAARGLQASADEQDGFSSPAVAEAIARRSLLSSGLDGLSLAIARHLRRVRRTGAQRPYVDRNSDSPRLAWAVLDSAWFKAHGKRMYRLRRALPGELPDRRAAAVDFVLVRRLDAAQRLRLPLPLHDGAAYLSALPDADLALAPIWEVAAGIPDGGEATFDQILNALEIRGDRLAREGEK